MEDIEKVQDALPGHIELTRQEKGCIKFDVVRDQHQMNKFTVYEEFVDQAAFDRHQQRVKNSEWGKISRSAERHYQLSNSEKN